MIPKLTICSPTQILSQDLGEPSLCPVLFFFTLAYFDVVFVEEGPPENFFKSGGKEVRFLKLKKSFLDVPVFRTSRTFFESDVQKILPWQSSDGTSYIKDIGRRMGWKAPPTAYAFRRGAANALTGNLTPHLVFKS
jgi:hypothetical protein